MDNGLALGAAAARAALLSPCLYAIYMPLPVVRTVRAEGQLSALSSSAPAFLHQPSCHGQGRLPHDPGLLTVALTAKQFACMIGSWLAFPMACSAPT